MHIWAISDLHLSFDENYRLTKPMDIFGSFWHDHPQKIAESWRQNVHMEDIVLLGGDISWALKPEKAQYDLNWLKSMPGKKIMIKGNHDLWWQATNKTKSLLAPMIAIANDAIIDEEYAICGAKGYQMSSMDNNPKLEHREALRLENSLKIGAQSGKKIIALLHYPPYGENGADNVFSELLRKYQVEIAIFGHLHKNVQNCIRQYIDEIPLYLVSADYLNFALKLIK